MVPVLQASLPLLLSSPPESPFNIALFVFTRHCVTYIGDAMTYENSLSSLNGLLCLMLFVCSRRREEAH